MREDAPHQNSPAQIRLLRTKLFVPQPLPDLLARARLEERLDAGAACRLTLLSAPAGSGKTTLLSRWIQQRGLRVAWVSLDTADNDPARFWLYVFSALEGQRPGLGAGALASLGRSPLPPIEVSLTELINAGSALNAPLALVLDDYHAITLPAIHSALAFLLENLPPALHIIIATRQNPPFPLALLRARRQLVELSGQDLRFRPDEVALWLNQVLGLGLRAEDVAALEARTAGWAAGIQLAALCLAQPGERAGQDSTQFIDSRGFRD
jgi:LuxR family transcriptional regulator, maltose regulon positive regulatory protein